MRKEPDKAATEALAPERAFVVQFATARSVRRARLKGRIEHVVSGDAWRFRSTAELLDFVTRTLAQTAKGETMKRNGKNSVRGKGKRVKALAKVGDKQAARVRGGATASQVAAPEYTRTGDGSVLVGNNLTIGGR